MQTEEQKKDWHRQWYLKNKEKVAQKGKEYREKNKDKIKIAKKKWQQSQSAKNYMINYYQIPEKRERFRRQQWKRKYGLSLDDADRMMNEQNGECAICHVLLEVPCVDHCHKTKQVRGFLCYSCNLGLGAFRDNPQSLINAADYLRKKA